MSDQFVGEIRLFAGNYAPEGWHFCDGTVLPISGYDTLYAVLGTIYGGDGISNFGLPDLRSRAPMHQGTGANPVLTQRVIGAKFGTEAESISTAQLAAHSHIFTAANANATLLTVQNNVLAITPVGDNFYAPASSDPSQQVNLISGMIGTVGGGGQHDNRMPYIALNYIIALQGYFPQQQ